MKNGCTMSKLLISYLLFGFKSLACQMSIFMIINIHLYKQSIHQEKWYVYFQFVSTNLPVDNIVQVLPLHVGIMYHNANNYLDFVRDLTLES